MPAPVIAVNNLSKHYKVPVRESGLRAATKSLFKRKYNTVKAVDSISFTIDPGEVVGFLSPNGAVKTTTLEQFPFSIRSVHPFLFSNEFVKSFCPSSI